MNMNLINIKSFLIYLLIFIALIIKAYANPGLIRIIQNNELQYEDRIYQPMIKTVNLYVDKGYPATKNEPPIFSIRNPRDLILEFDEIAENARYFQAYIIHCDWNWKPSQLRPIEYLNEYNEFEIYDYAYSVNTKVLYAHYRFTLPPVMKIPGNYLLVVTDKNNPEELILSRRFMVFDNLVRINPSITLSSGVKERRTHQQIEFEISYGGIEVFNPREEIRVVIRQNQSWYTAIYDLKPTIVREMQNLLEYKHFNFENNFFGGNEFRFFEINSVRAPGMNVDRVYKNDQRYDVFLMPDKDRSYAFYGVWEDLNGGFIISNIDGIENSIESEYVNIHFFIETGSKLDSDVYLFGKMSDFDILPEYQMSYDDELGGYTGNQLLKQGIYDYIYFTPDQPYQLEGSHYETRNDYEILVYHQPQGKITQYLVGYLPFNNKLP